MQSASVSKKIVRYVLRGRVVSKFRIVEVGAELLAGGIKLVRIIQIKSYIMVGLMNSRNGTQ